MSTDCFVNISVELKAEILKDQLRHKTTKVYKHFYGYLGLPLAIIGLGITIVFVLAVIRAIKQHRVSRKCYVLIVNRSFGDILACVAAIVNSVYVLISPEPNRDIVNVIDTFFVSSFWSGMISYVALSLLKLYAVARPFNYRKRVTMKRCIYLVAISWCFFLFILTYALGVSAITKIPMLREWSGCKIETCLRSMYRTRNMLMCIIYFLTIICFVCTVMFINRARNFVNSFHQKNDGTNKPKILRNRFPMWKLAVNVGTFAGFNVFYIIWAIALLVNTDRCMFLRNFPTMIKIYSLIRLILICRIILDPILSFFTDFQIQRSVTFMFGINNVIKPSDSRKPFQKSMSEENSSENTPNGKPSIITVEERLTVKGASIKKSMENSEI